MRLGGAQSFGPVAAHRRGDERSAEHIDAVAGFVARIDERALDDLDRLCAVATA